MAMKLWELAGAEDDRLFSPYCWRVRMMLAHKGLSAGTVPWRFTDKEAIGFSGQGLVPVLLDGEREVHDSWAIAEYLDEAYPQRPLLFADAQAHASALFFRLWCERNLHLAILRLVILDIHSHLHDRDKAYFRESREKRFGKTLEEFAAEPTAALAALRGVLDPVRPVLVQHRYASGAAPGMADYILFGAFQWARVVSPIRLLEPDDPVYAWRERMLDLYDGLARKAKAYAVWT